MPKKSHIPEYPDRPLNDKLVQFNTEIPKSLKIKIDSEAKRREIPKKWLVIELIEKGLFEDIFQVRLEKSLPKLISNSLSEVDFVSRINEILSRLGPTLDIAELQAIEVNTRAAFEELQTKFKLLYIIALSSVGYQVEVPKDFLSLQLIADLVSTGFVQSVDGELKISDTAYQDF